MTVSYKRSRWERNNPNPFRDKLRYIILLIAVGTLLMLLDYLING